MSTERNVPKLRFPGFTEPWEQRKVSEIGNIVTGSTPKTSISDNYGGEFLFVSPADIQENRYVDETITTLTKKGFDQGRKIREKASLFVSIGSTIGKVAQTSQESTTNQQINAVEPYDNFDDDFIFTSLENISGSIKAIASNQAVPIVNKTTFGETEIKVPSELAEQQKIGAYFRNLDHIITLHQRKLKHVKDLKKSMLQKMFPKNGQEYPELRFPGFTEPWVQRKLSEVAEIVGGGTPSTNIPEYWDGDIDWYAPAEINDQIYVGGSERKITKLGLEKSSAKILPADKTVLFTSRAGIGKTAILRRSGATNQGFQSMVLNDETNPYFVFSMSKFIKEEAERVASGSTFAEVSGKMLGNLAFMFPTKKEQDKIGEYFSNLDNLITLHQRELKHLKLLKKGMLQQILI